MTWHPRQLAQQTGRTFVVTGANASARDPATAARLWELTEQALGRPLPV